MKYLQTLTDDEARVLVAALAGRERCPTVADWLWRIKEFREAAKRLGIQKPKRIGRGRPRKTTTY